MPTDRRAWFTNALVAAIYLIVGYSTLALDGSGGVELRRVIWVASGIAVSVALLRPYPVWLGAGIGGALTTTISGSGAIMILGTGIANGLEVVLAVWFLRRARFDARLERVRDVLLLIALGSGLATLLPSLISVLSLHLSGDVASGDFVRLTTMWWLTHAIGVVVLTPVTLTLACLRRRIASHHWLELTVVMVGVAIASWIPFESDVHALAARLFVLPFPLLLWAAVRLGVGGAALGAFITSVCALWGAVAHTGPLSVASPKDVLMLTWLFVNVVTISTLISAALVAKLENARGDHQRGEARLQAVLDSVEEGIIVTDGSGSVSHVNRAIAQLWPNDAMTPRMGDPITTSIDSLANFVLPAHRATLASGMPHSGALVLQDARIWQLQLQPLGPRSGPHAAIGSNGAAERATPSGAVWSFRDVSKQVHAEEERQQLLAKMLQGQKLESLGVMAGGIAHDFNNLLMAIRARTELIGDLGDLPEEGREDVTAILSVVDQATALCRQMLVYAGRGTLDVRTIDLSELARSIPELLRLSVSRRVALTIGSDAEPLWVAGDATQLRQVALNLVTNASDAIEAAGRGGTVRISTRRERLNPSWFRAAVLGSDAVPGDFCLLEVEDVGAGMSPETMRRIFDPFFSSKGAGRGLGLAAVVGIVRGHRGALRVESTVGVGSRFSVALPAAPAPDVPEVGRATGDERHVIAGGRILVVDDDVDVRQSVVRLLTRSGALVTEAADGESALAQLASSDGAAVDLVLLDLTMPGMGGPATLSTMRERGITTPVIIASGYSSEHLRVDEGEIHFVQKPYRGEELRRLIAEVLNVRNEPNGS